MSEEVYIANAARRRIEGETKQDLSAWSGPTVVTVGREYKVESRPPESANVAWNEAVLTIYENGEWELYALDGQAFSGQMMAPHDSRWIGELSKDGVYAGHAKSSWAYFKNISLGGHG